MHVIRTRNVNQALPLGIELLGKVGEHRDSRNGPVLAADQPVTTLYARPRERVLFSAARDANPFFHLFESLWMLGGRHDLRFLTEILPTYRNFSDNGRTVNGAYGHRWRTYFDRDQLADVCEYLRKNPSDRRVVLTMWDPSADLGSASKDVPCNTHVYFRVNSYGELDMTVCCRSNDILWGAYGANAVHFSVLQEYAAGCVGIQAGNYWQISNDYHAYVGVMEKYGDGLPDESGDHYTVYPPMEMMDCSKKDWDTDLQMFLGEGPIVGFNSRWFRRVVTPMWHAHAAYRAKNYDDAIEIMGQCAAQDWRRACVEWLGRRKKNAENKTAGSD